jgi:tRNA (cmo5U34)-methyltransferase
MDKVKKHFEEEAKEFDQTVLKLISHYKEMIEALISAIPFEQAEPIEVIDLGCGTGEVAKNIKERFPNAKVTCLDIAEKMIEMAKKKMEKYPDITYLVGDFRDFEFDKKYEVIVSSLALHHLPTDEDKKQFYKKIFDSLLTGGVFYNADLVLGSSDYLQEVYIAKWKEFMRQNISLEEVENKWIPMSEEEDRPAKLIDQLNWLTEIGFTNVDVIWKYYNFAVYGGLKQKESERRSSK